MIDAQREYVDGALPLPGVRPALEEIGRLLARARAQRTPVIHIVHHAKSGKLFAGGFAQRGDRGARGARAGRTGA